MKKIYILALVVAALFIHGTVNAAQLRKVSDISHVCMVNNEDMGKPQIPVTVGSRTYYGCCKMCVGTLTNDRKSRYAVDPVSGNEVDKTKAVIGAMTNGSVLYFENEQNFQAFILK